MFHCGICSNRFKSEKTLQGHVKAKHQIDCETTELFWTVTEDPQPE